MDKTFLKFLTLAAFIVMAGLLFFYAAHKYEIGGGFF